jgi:endonuclease/exonuclease/phosphatase family metal-dependent hydrolase
MKYKIISYLLCCYMIFSQMNPDASSTFFNESFASPGGNSIRVVSYNIHFGASKKGKPAISVVSRFLSLVDPDILCLQEVDQNTIRSLFLDQSTKLNEDLSMKIAY